VATSKTSSPNHAAKIGVVALFQVHQQQGDGRRRQPRDTGRLTQGFGSHVAETLPRFVGQTADLGIIEIARQAHFLVAHLPVDLLTLALEITGIFGLDFHLERHLLRQSLIAAPVLRVLEGARRNAPQIAIVQFRPA
jgi:hypothetical protein